jgi:hypothetical protein
MRLGEIGTNLSRSNQIGVTGRIISWNTIFIFLSRKQNPFFFLEHRTEMTWTDILLTSILNEHGLAGKLASITRTKHAYSLTVSQMKAVKIPMYSLQVEMERRFL